MENILKLLREESDIGQYTNEILEAVDQDMREVQQPGNDRWQRFVTAYSAIKRAERMDANDIYERSQEAAHYNWLDEENEKLEAKIEKLEAEKKELVEALEFYANLKNWERSNHRDFLRIFKGDHSEENIDEGDWPKSKARFSFSMDRGKALVGGKKAREVLTKIKSDSSNE